MAGFLAQLTAVLEQEISIAEELECNLAAQKKALVGWNIAELLQQITAREPWLRALSALENKRADILKELRFSKNAVTLRHLISAFPQDGSETARLRCIRERACDIFTRLHNDEQALHRLMENMLAHIHEALRPLLHSTAPLYSETGAAEPPKPTSALIHSKA
jgi:flagellar biosynthesis/type III secretory pathway chaperone